MNTRLVYANDEGGLSIVVPAPEMFDANSRTRQELAARGITFANDAEVLAYISGKDVPEGKPYRSVDLSALPPFRDFRNAWIDDGVNIGHDMTKANEIKREKLREIRKPLLEKLDVDYMRADEAKDEAAKAAVAAQKEALRDVTDFEDIQDIQALKDYMPDVLK